jgi:hypothetical protein
VAAGARPDAGRHTSVHPDRRVRSVRKELPFDPNDSISLRTLYKRGNRLGLTLLAISIENEP